LRRSFTVLGSFVRLAPARLAWLIVCISLSLPAAAEHAKQMVGAVETITIMQAGINVAARIDTGAASCSLDATDIHPLKPLPDGKQQLSFVISNNAGDKRQLTAVVDSIVRIRNAEGSSMRYKVPLTVNWHGRSKTVLFTLTSRRNMHYRALLGRNWLYGDYIVDVSRTATVQPQ